MENVAVHEFRLFIQEHMDANKWTTNAQLARAAGLLPQHVGDLLNDNRDRLLRLPEPKTIAGLSKAFNVPENVILLAAARAYGIPVDEPVKIPTASGISNEQLLAELSMRLAPRERPTRGTLDLDIMEHKAISQIIKLMVSLRDDAGRSAKNGDEGLALAQRFLADQLEAAIDATVDPVTADEPRADRAGA